MDEMKPRRLLEVDVSIRGLGENVDLSIGPVLRPRQSRGVSSARHGTALMIEQHLDGLKRVATNFH